MSSKPEDRERIPKIPVMQAWAGDGYGFQVTPRDGMQVIVGYLDDQGDRPVIMGCLHSDAAPQPWGGMDANKVGFKTQSRWPRATRSEKGFAPGRTTGWSEISIDDTGNHEKVYVRAEKDFAMDVIESRVETVGTDATDNIGGSFVRHVARDANFAADGNVSDLVGGHRTEHVGGNRSVAVGGNTDESYSGGRSVTVNNTQDTRIQGDMRLQVCERMSTRIGGALDCIVGGTSASTVTAEGPLHVHAKEIVLSADESFTIQVGENRIVVNKNGIQIEGKRLDASADTIFLGGSGPSVHIHEDIEMFGKKINLYGEKGSVSIDQNLELLGTQVKLGSPDAKKDKTSPHDSTKKQVKFQACVDGKPQKGKQFHFVVEGTRMKGQTDGDGNVSIEVPKDAKQGVLSLWTDTFPEGPRRQWTVQLEKLEAADSLKGVQQRLRNRGNEVEISGELDELTHTALTKFKHANAVKHTSDAICSQMKCKLDSAPSEM